ncbi:leucine--tRNA ligase [Persicobacter diffluens]|uniref:Leucine--tRNA ligase n=1 Tax=Persicobacter diffluens TaxID=981 RepID=A0AAN5ALA1_9BACT|nr:leucine--tRNA ligase [Persicobacter diffluens]
MAEYNFRATEKKWQQIWKEQQTYKADVDASKPKFYTLDMFPYPSGAGLHVGHPLGYIGSDIVARYKKLKGFNVLHPMGFDSFGLPAEQYAIQTGQHPAKTTEDNIARYKEQLANIGFSFDWDKEVRTSDASYYKWTQWIFMQLFDAFYDHAADKAKHINELIAIFEKEGNATVDASCDEDTPAFTAAEWNAFSEKEQSDILLKYRLTYLADAVVNWCPELGTVLANDEVVNGVSERGGYPVERKLMKQWMMRITAYAERLLTGLEEIDFSESLREMQRNWIGKSKGCSLHFKVDEKPELDLEVFTTRVDTAFGVTFMTIAPEHELIGTLTSDAQKAAVDAYVEMAKNRSERERMSDVKTISGVFTGSYAINPFNGEKIPIWIADYVLAGYGTGIVMAVPCSDTRDFAFANHFGLPVIPVQEGKHTDIAQDDFDPKAGKMINSGFLNGMEVPEAIEAAINWVEEKGLGKGKVNYRIRNAVFSRQRYWGEPVPVYFENGIPKLMKESELPLELPAIDEYKPTATGEPPLGRATDWTYNGLPYELSTMPGWAGSSWYFLRYMDPHNEEKFADAEALKYWNQVDLYVGGAEHAVGHLLYSRFWTKFLFDMGFLNFEEPFKKLINQGMIQGRSNFVYRVKGTNQFVSYGLKKDYEVDPLYVDVNIVSNDVLDLEAFKKWRPDYANAEFILEDGKYVCGAEVEKMSKSKYNVVNPDDIIERYGADTFRMYEMFLGPLEQFKPWNTNGIDGVYKFLRKFWNLFHEGDDFVVTDEEPTKAELKALHATIKKVTYDLDHYIFNTSVSQFMIATNELGGMKCKKRAILEQLVVLIAPYAPHIAEELWAKLGHTESVTIAAFPEFNESYLVEDEKLYPIMINGKKRAEITVSASAKPNEIQEIAMQQEAVIRWMEGKQPKKVIVVPNKIVNIVL